MLRARPSIGVSRSRMPSLWVDACATTRTGTDCPDAPVPTPPRPPAAAAHAFALFSRRSASGAEREGGHVIALQYDPAAPAPHHLSKCSATAFQISRTPGGDAVTAAWEDVRATRIAGGRCWSWGREGRRGRKGLHAGGGSFEPLKEEGGGWETGSRDGPVQRGWSKISADDSPPAPQSGPKNLFFFQKSPHDTYLKMISTSSGSF